MAHNPAARVAKAAGDGGGGDGYLVLRRGAETLCAVCDGVGGHAAVRLTLSMLRASFQAGAAPSLVFGVLAAANREILVRARAVGQGRGDPEWKGTGATAVVALFVPGRALLAHVGDSRIYRLRDSELEQLTTEHTLVNQYRLARPELRDEELRGLPQNVVVRALGMKDDVEIDRSEVETSPGDIFLLCSHGFFAVVGDDVIASILGRRTGSSVKELMDAHAARASASQPDDATVVVYR